MFADQSTEGQDLRVLEYFGFEDFDMDTIKGYRQRFIGLNPDHPWGELEIKDFLKQIKAWSVDRKTGKEGPTAAGLLFFGKNNSITDAFHEFFLDYREKLSDDPEVRWTDRVWFDGRWEGNLYQFYFRVIGKLTEGLKIPFRMENLVRIDETHVHEALKEAFVNCIIHADYNLPTGLVVIRDKTGYTFSNSGNMKIPPEIAMQGGNSIPRNPTIQKFFSLIKIGERAGSGLPKIIRAWKEQHWRNIELTEETSPDRTVLRLWTASLIPKDCLQELGELYGDSFEILGQIEVTVLVTAYLEGFVSNKRLQLICKEHPYDLTKTLQGLVERGFLVTNNKAGRGAVYYLNKDYKVNSLGNNDVNSLGNDMNSLGNDTNSLGNDMNSLGNDVNSLGNNDVNSLGNDVNSLGNDVNFLGNDANSLGNDVNSLDNDNNSEHIELNLIDITREARGRKRLTATKMQEIIIAACRIKPLSLSNLSELLHRNAESLRIDHISKLVREGKLQLLFPDEPNHPQQAYIAK